MFLEYLGEILVGLVLASVGVVWGLCIDQAQRWSLWGYIPTVIAVPFQKTKEKTLVLLQKVHGEWGFPQGRLQRSGLIASLNYLVGREVGLQPNDFKNSPFIRLGVLRFEVKEASLPRFSIVVPGDKTVHVSNIDPYTQFSFFAPRGKGYMFTLCACRLTELEERLKQHKCYEVEEMRIVPVEEAEALMLTENAKKVFHKIILDSLKKV